MRGVSLVIVVVGLFGCSPVGTTYESWEAYADARSTQLRADHHSFSEDGACREYSWGFDHNPLRYVIDRVCDTADGQVELVSTNKERLEPPRSTPPLSTKT